MQKIRLRTSDPRAIRGTLTRIMNMVVNGQMDNKTANTLILACNAVLSSIRTDEQQKKLDMLEKVITSENIRVEV